MWWRARFQFSSSVTYTTESSCRSYACDVHVLYPRGDGRALWMVSDLANASFCISFHSRANQCNSLGVIISGFLSFGVAHVSPTSRVHPWQWLMIMTALITFGLSILFLCYFPDNPTNAWFLTADERLNVVKRTRGNQTGIETKVWKKKQLLEALSDIKTWLFFLFITIL